MRRRAFIGMVGGAAIALPRAARAQSSARPAIGFLHPGSAETFAFELDAFRQGLRELGFAEGQTLTIEYRWAEGNADRLPAMAADLVRRQVAVIVAMGGDVTALAARAATSTIPIVFQNGSDPVRNGLVASINRPGGNVTGVSLFAGTVDAKRLELLHQVVPAGRIIAALTNPLVAETDSRSLSLQEAARSMGLQLVFLRAGSESDLEAAFAAAARQKADAIFVDGSPFFVRQRVQVVALAARYAMPASYAWREFIAAGGLMSYGTNLASAARQTALYVSRILGGAHPAELPVLQPTKLDLVVNVKTAKALGLELPPQLLALADEVIE